MAKKVTARRAKPAAKKKVTAALPEGASKRKTKPPRAKTAARRSGKPPRAKTAARRSGTAPRAKTAAKSNGLDADMLWSMYRKMVQIRKFEEHVWDVYTRGLMPGLAHLYIGEEAVAVGACAALREDDYITSTHRGHGHCLAKGARLDRMMAEIMGKEAGYCRGKGGSMHIADMSMGNLGANGIVGGGFGVATGAALSAKMRGTDQVSLCFFGDGAANQGILLETGNMAAIWNLPIIYVCENNQYGEHTPSDKVTGSERIVDRAEAMGLAGVRVEGADVMEVYEVVAAAVSRARRGDGATFVEMMTYRFRGHHVGDAATYRTAKELKWWMENRDPINLLGERMIKHGIADRSRLERVDEQVEEEVVEAVEFARNAPLPPAEQAREDVYA